MSSNTQIDLAADFMDLASKLLQAFKGNATEEFIRAHKSQMREFFALGSEDQHRELFNGFRALTRAIVEYKKHGKDEKWRTTVQKELEDLTRSNQSTVGTPVTPMQELSLADIRPKSSTRAPAEEPTRTTPAVATTSNIAVAPAPPPLVSPSGMMIDVPLTGGTRSRPQQAPAPEWMKLDPPTKATYDMIQKMQEGQDDNPEDSEYEPTPPEPRPVPKAKGGKGKGRAVAVPTISAQENKKKKEQLTKRLPTKPLPSKPTTSPSGSRERRRPQASNELFPQPCERCATSNSPCMRDVALSTCVACARLKLKCTNAGKRGRKGLLASRPRQGKVGTSKPVVGNRDEQEEAMVPKQADRTLSTGFESSATTPPASPSTNTSAAPVRNVQRRVMVSPQPEAGPSRIPPAHNRESIGDDEIFERFEEWIKGRRWWHNHSQIVQEGRLKALGAKMDKLADKLDELMEVGSRRLDEREAALADRVQFLEAKVKGMSARLDAHLAVRSGAGIQEDADDDEDEDDEDADGVVDTNEDEDAVEDVADVDEDFAVLPDVNVIGPTPSNSQESTGGVSFPQIADPSYLVPPNQEQRPLDVEPEVLVPPTLHLPSRPLTRSQSQTSVRTGSSDDSRGRKRKASNPGQGRGKQRRR